MLKRYLSGVILFAACISMSYAGSFYVAPALSYQDLSSDDLSFQGISPTLYVGYGDWFRDYLFVAAEIFVSSRAIELSSDETTDGIKLDKGSSYGFSVLPTMNLASDLMAYLRIGYVRTDFSGVDSKQGAYQVGIGGEMPLTGCWSVRAEFDYTPYRSVDNIGTIRAKEISLAAVYRFESLFDGPTL